MYGLSTKISGHCIEVATVERLPRQRFNCNKETCNNVQLIRMYISTVFFSP